MPGYTKNQPFGGGPEVHNSSRGPPRDRKQATKTPPPLPVDPCLTQSSQKTGANSGGALPGRHESSLQTALLPNLPCPLQRTPCSDYHSAIVHFFPGETLNMGPDGFRRNQRSLLRGWFSQLLFNLIGHRGKRPNQARAAIEGGESGEAGRNHPNGPACDGGRKATPRLPNPPSRRRRPSRE